MRTQRLISEQCGSAPPQNDKEYTYMRFTCTLHALYMTLYMTFYMTLYMEIYMYIQRFCTRETMFGSPL